MQTFHPRYLLRIRPIPSILAGCSLIPLRKLHLESHFQQLFTKLPSLKLFHPDGQTADKFSLEWKEFYTRARAIHSKGSCGDLKKLSEEPVDLFNASHTTLNAIDETFKKMEKDEPYNFPRDNDPTLHAACEALSHALQEASRAEAEHDTPEIKQALDNLRRAYNEAAESNTVSMRYIDIEPPYSPFSPLKPTKSLKRTLLARSWVKELITAIRGNHLGRQILVVGQPDSGEPFKLTLPLMPPTSLHS
jgi:hypothetical protein